MQEIALSGMQTPVTIFRRTVVAAGSDEYDDQLTFVRTETLNGWLSSTPTPVAEVNAGALVTANTYRLYLPVGTDIQPGDRVTIGARTYTVSDTTAESTWPALLAVSLRGRE